MMITTITYFSLKMLLIWSACQQAVLSLKEFSLARFSDVLVYANNSVIDGNLVGEGFEEPQITEGGALECHTDDTSCCRSTDGMAGGEWYGPDGNRIPSPAERTDGDGLYRTRKHMVIRLNCPRGITPTGVYRCEIPGAGGVTITRYITLTRGESLCDDLPPITNGSITYTPPHALLPTLPDGQRYQGIIATYNCSPGYQLVGGSTQRACVDGTWNGTVPTCEIVTQPTTAATTMPTDPPVTTPIATTSTEPPSTASQTTDAHTPVIDCGPLSALDNGQVDTSFGTTFGSTATYSCDTGYILSGSSTRTCEADGNWMSTAPVCEIIDCGPLDAPDNGQVDTSFGTTFDSMATYTCLTNFTVGLPIRSCQANGMWSSIAPTCQIGSEPSEVSGIVGGVVAVLWFIISIIIIAILVGYILYLKNSKDNEPTSPGAQYATVGGVSAPEYEVMEGGGAEYEEIDKVKEKRGQPRPPNGDYELTQCAAYGPVNTNNA